jgi:RNA polymerase sigma factor (sigma-70 family)
MANSENSEPNKTIDHLFRNEAGKMVAVLVRLFGFSNIEQAEDIVQDTILKALQTWRYGKLPENPQAWLYKAAKNNAIDIIRRNKLKYKIENEISVFLKSEYTLVPSVNEMFTDGEIKDSQLRMMFACCHPEVSVENQMTLILKTLCGFSTQEIAKSFLASEDTVSKRLYRTKEFFRENKIKLIIPSLNEIKNRTDAVLNTIYLLFNEGYNSTHSEALIRMDVIEEAMTLCKLLTENKHTQLPEVFALMALMCFHSSRSDSRLSAEGEIILLAKQDRSKWNTAMIIKGNQYMNKAAFGSEISSFHLEAAIAFEHCVAENFEQTNWNRILNYYESLCKISNSPIIKLNKIIVVMQVNGPRAALLELEIIHDKKKLETYYLYYSLLGEIYSKLQNIIEAKKYFECAIKLTQSETEKRMLSVKIAALLN